MVKRVPGRAHFDVFSEKEAAEFLGITVPELREMGEKGIGPERREWLKGENLDKTEVGYLRCSLECYIGNGKKSL